MDKTEKIKHRYGLIGRNIAYSFSRGYFSAKFRDLGLEDHIYQNYDLSSIDEFPDLIRTTKNLKGLNVTIPYKESIIPYLDHLDSKVLEIGAVNTIQFTGQGLVGHNTDIYGFEQSLIPLLTKQDRNALILGSGGASKAIAYVLSGLGIDHKTVSRHPSEGQYAYEDLDKDRMSVYTIIVNTTPLGTFPDVGQKPKIPYEHLTRNHLLFDLIYNPERTSFLLEGESRGTRISNGLKMLELQAEKAWEIWNSV